VRVRPRHGGAFAVVLARTTAAERDAFDAPASGWRIGGFS
jgi:hypothetical protein